MALLKEVEPVVKRFGLRQLSHLYKSHSVFCSIHNIDNVNEKEGKSRCVLPQPIYNEGEQMGRSYFN